MTCPNCRSTIPDSSRFCEYCGTSIERKPVYASPAAPVFNIAHENRFPLKAREIASGPLMLWLAILFSAQFAFNVIASGLFSLALIISIPELIAYWIIYSNAKSTEPDHHSGLNLLKGYYNFLFIFMIVVGSLAVLAGVIVGIAVSALGNSYSGDFGGRYAGAAGAIIIVLSIILLPIIFGIVCFFLWAKRKYVRSLYDSMTIGSRPQWSVFIAVILFIGALNAFSSIGNAAVMSSPIYSQWMQQLLSELPANISGYFSRFMSTFTGYKAIFSSLQALCNCGYAVLAGVIVLKLKNAE